MDLAARRRLADANVLARFALTQRTVDDPRGGIARFGAVDVVAVGVDAPFFNAVFATRPETAPDDVVAAIHWVEARGLPVMARVRDDLDPTVRGAVEGLGLALAHPLPMPAMALDPIPPPPLPAAPLGVVVRTGGAELHDDFHLALESGEVIRAVFGPALVADPGVRLAVAFEGGDSVACAAAVRSEATIGLYAIATVERARRRGIGTAVTWAVIEAGRAAWGGTIATLHSSEVGVPVYRSMGFEEIAGELLYRRPER